MRRDGDDDDDEVFFEVGFSIYMQSYHIMRAAG